MDGRGRSRSKLWFGRRTHCEKRGIKWIDVSPSLPLRPFCAFAQMLPQHLPLLWTTHSPFPHFVGQNHGPMGVACPMVLVLLFSCLHCIFSAEDCFLAVFLVFLQEPLKKKGQREGGQKYKKKRRNSETVPGNQWAIGKAPGPSSTILPTYDQPTNHALHGCLLPFLAVVS